MYCWRVGVTQPVMLCKLLSVVDLFSVDVHSLSLSLALSLPLPPLPLPLLSLSPPRSPSLPLDLPLSLSLSSRRSCSPVLRPSQLWAGQKRKREDSCKLTLHPLALPSVVMY